MPRRTAAAAALVALALAVAAAWALRPAPPPAPPADTTPGPVEPDDAFFRQRAFPTGRIDGAALRRAQREAARLGARATGPGWQFVGPTNVSGRVSALAVESFDRFYVGTASGGVFWTDDGGATFSTVGAAFTAPTGALALDRSGALYVGTGEANGGGGSVAYEGSGVWRTRDGGATFEALGLERTGSIGRIAVHPTDPDVLLVAAMGALYQDTPDRGLYRSDDGGATWTQTLFVDEGTGAIDVAIHPAHPDTVYAATWERERRLATRDYGGDGSGVWRSADAGRTWTRLAGGLPEGPDLGRIGLSIAASRPSTVYAVATDSTGYLRGLYRSDDGGEAWAGDRPNVFGPSYGWWFGQVRADPTDPETVYLPWLELAKSTDGGARFSDVNGGMHVDHHALWIDPADPDRLIAGNDGGVYRSDDGGARWRPAAGLPSTQFYTVDADRGRLIGGTQDNGTVLDADGLLAWETVLGGDGLYCRFDPSDPTVFYAAYQRGNFVRFGPGSGATAITPPGGPWNWAAPLELSPLDPREIYVGSNRVHRSRNRGDAWEAISPVLAPGPSTGNLAYRTVTTIAASGASPDVLWAGTDTGRVWTTSDGGTTWRDVSAGLPERWITRVAAHPTDPAAAVVTVSGFRWAEAAAHVFETADGGATWTPLADGLPDAPVNDVQYDPVDPRRVAVATDVGVFERTPLAGWSPLAPGLPVVPVTDLALDGRRLVAATYGRGMYAVEWSLPTAAEAGPEALRVGVGPNPSRGTVSVRLDAGPAARVEVAVFDVRGRRLATLFEGVGAPDVLRWEAPASGVVVVRATVDGRAVSRRVTVVR